MEQEPAVEGMGRQGQAVRVVAPVWSIELHPVPGDPGMTQDLVQTQISPPPSRLNRGDEQQTCEPVDFGVPSSTRQSNQLISLSWQ